MRQITDSEPKPIREINPDMPEWMSEVISKLMAKSEQDRLHSAAAVRTLLETCLSHVQQPLADSLPKLPWLANPDASQQACASSKSSLNLKTTILGGLLFAAILAFPLLPIKPTQFQQKHSITQELPIENDVLSQEMQSRLKRLVQDNSLVVVGKLHEGKLLNCSKLGPEKPNLER